MLALREAKNEAHQLSGELRRNDVAAVKETLRTIEAASATARSHSDNLLWDALARVPFLGDDVDAVQVMARALERRLVEGLPAGLDAARRVPGRAPARPRTAR